MDAAHTGRPDHAGHPDRLAGLAEAVAAADVISFDFFDTLFVRPLVDAEDAFDILGEAHDIEGFRTLRRAAQAQAFRVMHAEGRGEIDLDGIYRCFGDLPVRPDRLREAELELELKLTLPNPEMVAVLRAVLAAGKRAVIASDMYLRAPYFEELLRRHELPEVPLFVSAERGATKRDRGELFDVIAGELGVPHARILHIGDNEASDVAMARRKGLRAFHYREARMPPRRKGISPAASVARSLIRLHQEDVPPGSLRELGFLHAGPAVVGFLDWIAEEARRDGIEHVLFVARDGYVLDALATMPGMLDARFRHSYLLGSRVAFTLAGMTEQSFQAHLPFLLSGAQGLTALDVLDRIGVPAPAPHVMADIGIGEHDLVDLGRPGPMLDLLQAWRWEILKVCRRSRRGLLRHLLDLGLRAGERVAFVDVGWNGTTQEAFENALKGLLPLDVTGYYFCLSGTPDCRLRESRMRMKSLVGAESVPGELLASVYANRVVAEFFFSAPHAQVVGYADGADGVVCLQDAGRADSTQLAAMVSEAHEGIHDFARRFAAWREALALRPDPLGMAMPLLEFMSDGEWATHARLREVRNFDAWASSRNSEIRLTDFAAELR